MAACCSLPCLPRLNRPFLIDGRGCQEYRPSGHISMASSPLPIGLQVVTPRHRPRSSSTQSRWRFQCSAADNGASSSGLSEEVEANKPGGNPTPSASVRYRSRLEQLFHCDTAVPEERIETPRAVAAMPARAIGDRPPCPQCRAVGAVECATCAASGLYVDAVLESQGIIVKVRCLGGALSSSPPLWEQRQLPPPSREPSQRTRRAAGREGPDARKKSRRGRACPRRGGKRRPTISIFVIWQRPGPVRVNGAGFGVEGGLGFLSGRTLVRRGGLAEALRPAGWIGLDWRDGRLCPGKDLLSAAATGRDKHHARFPASAQNEGPTLTAVPLWTLWAACCRLWRLRQPHVHAVRGEGAPLKGERGGRGRADSARHCVVKLVHSAAAFEPPPNGGESLEELSCGSCVVNRNQCNVSGVPSL